MSKILFDSSHNEYLRLGKWGVPYLDNLPERFDWQKMAFFLAKCGFDLSILDGGRIPTNLIELCDIFVLGEPESHFYHSWPDVKRTVADTDKRGILSEEEINNILTFVKSGGGLLVFQEKYGEQRRGNNLNSLVRHFGVFFDDNLIETDHQFKNHSSWLRIENFEEHPVTKDVKIIVYFDGCSMVIEKGAKAVAFSDETAHPAEAPLVAVSEYGNGHVVCIGDATLFTEWGLGNDFEFRDQHVRFLWNIFRWLSPKEFISSKMAKQVSDTSSILAPIILDELQLINNEVAKLKKQQADTASSLSSSSTYFKHSLDESQKMVAEVQHLVKELPKGEEATSKVGYWLRGVDVIVNLFLMIAAFSFGLLLKDKIFPASSAALTLIIILSAISAFSLKVFGVPVIHKKND